MRQCLPISWEFFSSSVFGDEDLCQCGDWMLLGSSDQTYKLHMKDLTYNEFDESNWKKNFDSIYQRINFDEQRKQYTSHLKSQWKKKKKIKTKKQNEMHVLFLKIMDPFEWKIVHEKIHSTYNKMCVSKADMSADWSKMPECWICITLTATEYIGQRESIRLFGYSSCLVC